MLMLLRLHQYTAARTDPRQGGRVQSTAPVPSPPTLKFQRGAEPASMWAGVREELGPQMILQYGSCLSTLYTGRRRGGRKEGPVRHKHEHCTTEAGCDFDLARASA